MKINLKLNLFKSSPIIINFILKSIDNNKTITVKQIKKLILDEYKIDISVQLIYNILKNNNYVYKIDLKITYSYIVTILIKWISKLYSTSY